ncbi:transketolase family protein, partial [Candidatus Microgenomates bacterium]|nr:transketolase family protein [Candidatus Microgenomates bacterium]
MLNPKAHLSKKLFSKDIDMVPTRQGYGEGLVLAGEAEERVVVLCADLTE